MEVPHHLFWLLHWYLIGPHSVVRRHQCRVVLRWEVRRHRCQVVLRWVGRRHRCQVVLRWVGLHQQGLRQQTRHRTPVRSLEMLIQVQDRCLVPDQSLVQDRCLGVGLSLVLRHRSVSQK